MKDCKSRELSGWGRRGWCEVCCAATSMLRLPAVRIRRSLPRYRKRTRGRRTWNWSEPLASFSCAGRRIRGGPDGEARGFKLDDVLASARFWNQKKGADASALLRGDGSEFPQGDKSWPVDTRQGHIRNDEGPFAGLELREEHLGVWDNADAPAFGVKNLFDRTGAGGVAVKNEQAHLAGLDECGTSTHNTQL